MRTRPDTLSQMAVGDDQITVDEQGFLIDPDDWNERVAEEFARRLGVTLTDAHWAVVRFMRDFLAEHGVAADARFVFRFLEARGAKGAAPGREQFFQLFPYGYVSQACKIAGMRQPRAWSTG
jgi:TusE/DsrC/DsvC family sulfur relay protein